MRWGFSSSSLGGDGYDSEQLVEQLGASAVVILLTVSVFSGAAAATVSVGSGSHVGGAVGLTDTAEQDGPDRPPGPCRLTSLERFSNPASGFAVDGHEECPERPPEEEPTNPDDGGDSHPPEVLSFAASYDNSSSEVVVTVEFDEELGSGHVLLFDENDQRLGSGRLTEDVYTSGHVYDTSFDVPADEAANYTAQLQDADDRSNNEVEEPEQYTDTETVELASASTPTPTPEPTATPTPVPTPTPTPVPTAMPTATPIQTTIQEGIEADGGSDDGGLDATGPTTTTTEPPATDSSGAATETPNAAADVPTTTAPSAADEPSPTDSSSGSGLPSSAVAGVLLLIVALGGLVAYQLRD
jgi:hypothetical protein